jgi:tetratricopeptide (TPR) repeat protein
MRNIINFFLFSLLAIPMFAQPDTRPTIQVIEIEGALIDAKKEIFLEHFKEAITIYQSIIKKDKTNATAYYEMAKAYEASNKIKEAKLNAKDAFRLDKGNEWFGVYHAEFLIGDGAYQEAADIYRNIIIANPKNKTYYYERAYLLMKVKKYEEAIKIYADLEKIAGIEERSARHKHTIYHLMGKPAKAAEALEELIITFPSESQYYHLLAQYYESEGKSGKAKEIYTRALEMDSEDPVASIALAESMKASGDEAQYLLRLKPLFNRSEVNIDIKVKELYPYISKLPNVKDGVPKALLELSKIMTEVHPDDAKAFAIYADILYYSGNPREALIQYNKTLELDNSVFFVWEQVLLVNEELGQADELLKVSEDAMDLFPSQSFVYYMNGIAHNRKGKFEDAIDVLEDAMMMSGRDNMMKLKIHAALGVSYHGTKNYEDSDKSFDAALAIDNKNITVLNNYSFYLASRGKELEKAKVMITRANDLQPNQPTIQDTYGFVMYKSKNYKDAEKWWKKALSNGGNKNSETLEHYGDVLFQLGKVDEAMTYWQKAKDLGSNSKFLEQKILERKVID